MACVGWGWRAAVGPRGNGDAPRGHPRVYDQYPKSQSGVVYFGVPASVYQSCGGSGLATDAAAWGAVYLYGSGCHNRLRGAGGISIDASSAS